MLRILPMLLALLFCGAKIEAQCVPQLFNCPADPVLSCDLSLNSNQYWNNANWWDDGNQTHDLAETETDIHLSLRDTCPGTNFFIRCQLYLDLDRDGLRETVVDSDNPPAAGMVNFGNVSNLGTLRPFDQRPVPNNEKWRFALETTQAGDTLSARLRWNTELNPGVFVAPELPYGVHKVRWEISDNSGVLKTCDYDLVIKDCQAPSVTCQNGLSANILPTHQVELWATDFLQATDDNVTSAPYIRLGIRKANTGTGFPVDPMGNPVARVLYDCSELGAQTIELWAIDVAGNAEHCETTVMILDDNGICGTLGTGIDVCTAAICYNGFLGVGTLAYDLSYVEGGQPVEQVELANCSDIGKTIPINTDVLVKPDGTGLQNDFVHTFDLVLISKHINQEDTFDTPYQWVAADANLDGVITGADIVACRDYILGIHPLAKTWRFVEKNYVFPWPGNPLAIPFPESVSVTTSSSAPVKVEFYAIPICDVSCGNLVGFFELAPENEPLIGIPQPNPTLESAVLPLQLIQSETVFFELTNVSGKLLYQQTVMLPAGSAMFDIPAEAMPTTGLYFWRVRAGSVVKSGKISKI